MNQSDRLYIEILKRHIKTWEKSQPSYNFATDLLAIIERQEKFISTVQHAIENYGGDYNITDLKEDLAEILEGDKA